MDAKQYKPKEYEFSDGEGIEEGDLVESDSDQEGFEEFEDKKKKKQKADTKKVKF